MYVKHATHCAWRATYVYAGENHVGLTPDGNGRQLCYIGFDPMVGGGKRPTVFGGVAIGWPHRWTGFTFRVQLPALTWRTVAPRWLARLTGRCIVLPGLAWLYREQQSFLIWVDGRHFSRRGA